MEMERNCLENSSSVSFSKMMAPPPMPEPSTRSRYWLSALFPGGTWTTFKVQEHVIVPIKQGSHQNISLAENSAKDRPVPTSPAYALREKYEKKIKLKQILRFILTPLFIVYFFLRYRIQTFMRFFG